MKVVSLLPSATEIVAALGCADRLVGITHECDYPESVRGLPVVTSSVLDHEKSTSAEIDRHVVANLHEGSGIYGLDRDLLERLDPDLVLTQELCDVCAVSYKEVQQAVRERLGQRRVISLEPTTLGEVLETVALVGRELGAEPAAEELVRALRVRIDGVERATQGKKKPRVYAMEWLDPPFASGHWVPEMVGLAGGLEVLGRAGERSERIPWSRVIEAAPDVIVLIPCGFTVEQTIRHYLATEFPPEWKALPAVRTRRVYAVDANAYFSRPGPRLVDGLEILASILHPDLAFGGVSTGAAVPLERFETHRSVVAPRRWR